MIKQEMVPLCLALRYVSILAGFPQNTFQFFPSDILLRSTVYRYIIHAGSNLGIIPAAWDENEILENVTFQAASKAYNLNSITRSGPNRNRGRFDPSKCLWMCSDSGTRPCGNAFITLHIIQSHNLTYWYSQGIEMNSGQFFSLYTFFSFSSLFKNN